MWETWLFKVPFWLHLERLIGYKLKALEGSQSGWPETGDVIESCRINSEEICWVTAAMSVFFLMFRICLL